MKPSGERDVLWAPWREAYVLGEKAQDCVFCIDPAKDEERLVVCRQDEAFAVLNRYPYTNGHLLVAPVRHVADPTLLTDGEYGALMNMVRLGLKALGKAYDPMGINVGMNLGKAAGAGVEAHLHVHLVPRWGGDTNFMTVVSGTRVMCQDLLRTAEIVRDAFQSLNRS